MGNIFKPPCDGGVIWSALGTTLCGRVVGRWVLAATIIGSSMAFIDVAVAIILADGGQRY